MVRIVWYRISKLNVGRIILDVEVNLSSVWLLPEEGYPVFYRYFRDRITWYEADAVCQFHHGHLVTIDSPKEFDAARAYLKELDVTNFVWTGLKRAKSSEPFLWPESKEMSDPEGRWVVEVPKMEEALCAATDPSADFRWQPLPCSGPTVAAFICQMNVPIWAQNENGCMLTSLPSLTVTFLPEQGAVELISDCGLEGIRRIACKGQANRDEMIRQLACESSTEATQSETEETQQTRHRRGSEATTPTSAVPNATQEMTVSEEVSTTTEAVTTIATTLSTRPPTTTPTRLPTRPTTIVTQTTSTEIPTSGPGQVEVAVEIKEAGSKVAIKRTLSSKPIPPSLKGNSPFIEEVKNNTEEAVPLESHEALGEADVTSSVSPGTHPEMEEYKKNAQDSGEDHDTDQTDITEQTTNGGQQTTLQIMEAADQPMSDEPEPPERPNRGRLLIHPQHHSFYAYFLNRVLG
ncbi:uncharacterized protein [Halyomorpha halys]|uniref:uncharacterized protein n=1 Tax=Halyomorpha halys TaxID=286706 RepID=UPI0034D19E8A